jgi:hypothetical protein
MSEAEMHRKEWIQERAGILEFEAGLPREVAEERAAAQYDDDHQRAQARAGVVN